MADSNAATTTKYNNDNNQDGAIPFVTRLWLYVYKSIPSIKVPFLNLDIGFALFSSFILTCIRYTAEYVLQTYFGWPSEGTDATYTKEAAASCASICHSTTLCTGLIVAFLSQPYDPAGSLKESPKYYQGYVNALLQFCTGYMVYDAVINILWLRTDFPNSFIPTLGHDDLLFLGHHIMTSLYMTSSRVIQAGHMSAMACMLLGELTNPLHNSFMIGEKAMKLDCCNSSRAQSIHAIISVAFAAMYNLFRAILAPIILGHVSYCLIGKKKGRTNIPLLLNLLWNFMIWAVVFGSTSWIVKCHGILMDFMSPSTTKEQEL
jgi:hypothetical protein